MIRDPNIEWLRQIRRIPVSEFGFSACAAGPTTAVAKLVGLDNGDPLLDEVGSLGFVGGEVAAAGDSFTTLDVVTPSRIDPEEEIGVRVIYINNGATITTDAVTWVVLYNQADIGAAIAAPATALNTVIAAQSPTGTTTLVVKRTARGIINPNTFDTDFRAGVIAWNVEADALTTYDPDQVMFLALEIDYIPMLCGNRDNPIDEFSSLAAAG